MIPGRGRQQNSAPQRKQGPVSRRKQEPTGKLPNADWLEAGFGLGSGWVRLGSAGFGWVRLGSAGFGLGSAGFGLGLGWVWAGSRAACLAAAFRS